MKLVNYFVKTSHGNYMHQVCKVYSDKLFPGHFIMKLKSGGCLLVEVGRGVIMAASSYFRLLKKMKKSGWLNGLH